MLLRWDAGKEEYDLKTIEWALDRKIEKYWNNDYNNIIETTNTKNKSNQLAKIQ
jgi:hypothetical protein